LSEVLTRFPLDPILAGASGKTSICPREKSDGRRNSGLQ
jgi:hypothetical protein